MACSECLESRRAFRHETSKASNCKLTTLTAQAQQSIRWQAMLQASSRAHQMLAKRSVSLRLRPLVDKNSYKVPFDPHCISMHNDSPACKCSIERWQYRHAQTLLKIRPPDLLMMNTE
jgi:hypothetical protein